MAPLRVANLSSDGWACLRGQTVKAANTRALAPVFASIAEELYDDETQEYHRAAQRITRCLARLYEIMEVGGVFFLPP